MKRRPAVEESDRRAAILRAAAEVFLRFGFKKTSMEDVARVANISRQGLYLHFENKETLFKEFVVGALAEIREKSLDALLNEEVELEERLFECFKLAHGMSAGSAFLDELVASTNALLGPALHDLERELVAGVAKTLRSTGLAAQWKSADLSAVDLAEALAAASVGIKHQARSPEEFDSKLRVVVRVLCRGAPTPRRAVVPK